MSTIKGTKNNMLSFAERKAIVLEHYNSGLTFSELSKKHSISYSAVRTWCLNYELHGDEALVSKTGKSGANKRRGKNRERSTSKDPKDREIALLRKKLKQAEMEAEIRKKFDEAMEKLQNQQSTKR